MEKQVRKKKERETDESPASKKEDQGFEGAEKSSSWAPAGEKGGVPGREAVTEGGQGGFLLLGSWSPRGEEGLGRTSPGFQDAPGDLTARS